ncbi:inverse autotransporter beta domain-containing protein [Salmonella enterica]|nr:hypothetical protein [Salmonella enterica]EHD2148089.1 hypothetical protein [Salmonella enterica]EHK2354310.1 inverse autotransporter beta domain-containing protein [Salmonella enterica]
MPDTRDNTLAQNLVQVFGLTRAKTSGARNNMAAGMISSAAGAQAEAFLGRFGTARVQLGLDSQFRAEGSAVDVLLPLHDNQEPH